jgi:hypothetical protein
MKSLLFLIAAGAALLIWHVAYSRGQRGQRELREFTEECGSPGVRCVMLLSPEFLETHTSIAFPPTVTPALLDDDGTLREAVR